MKEFIEFLVTSLVKNPKNVAVEELGEGSNFKYSVTVDPADMGLVIGKEGRTINSIRALAKAKAVKDGVWVDVELVDYGRPTVSGSDAALESGEGQTTLPTNQQDPATTDASQKDITNPVDADLENA